MFVLCSGHQLNSQEVACNLSKDDILLVNKMYSPYLRNDYQILCGIFAHLEE